MIISSYYPLNVMECNVIYNSDSTYLKNHFGITIIVNPIPGILLPWRISMAQIWLYLHQFILTLLNAHKAVSVCSIIILHTWLHFGARIICNVDNDKPLRAQIPAADYSLQWPFLSGTYQWTKIIVWKHCRHTENSKWWQDVWITTFSYNRRTVFLYGETQGFIINYTC